MSTSRCVLPDASLLFCSGASVAVLESLSPRRGALRSMSDKPQTPPEKFQLRPHRCNDRIEDAIYVSLSSAMKPPAFVRPDTAFSSPGVV
jgi:hypothetical protein